MVKKLITLDGLAVFLSELRKEINAGSGKCFDAEELARRIPSWQWKVTLPKSEHQTVTATVGEQTYTDDFYALQGSQVTFSAKADQGYIAGTLSVTSATLNKDLVVTITATMESEELTAGTISFPPEYFDYRYDFELEVPPKVRVLKLETSGNKITYFSVYPGTKIKWYGDLRNDGSPRFIAQVNEKSIGHIYVGDYPITFSWSDEINSHSADIDLTVLAAQLKINGTMREITIPDEVKVLKMALGNEVKYVKLGKNRKLMAASIGGDVILNFVQIFSKVKVRDSEPCYVLWSDEIDTHTPDIEL